MPKSENNGHEVEITGDWTGLAIVKTRSSSLDRGRTTHRPLLSK